MRKYVKPRAKFHELKGTVILAESQKFGTPKYDLNGDTKYDENDFD